MTVRPLPAYPGPPMENRPSDAFPKSVKLPSPPPPLAQAQTKTWLQASPQRGRATGPTLPKSPQHGMLATAPQHVCAKVIPSVFSGKTQTQAPPQSRVETVSKTLAQLHAFAKSGAGFENALTVLSAASSGILEDVRQHPETHPFIITDSDGLSALHYAANTMNKAVFSALFAPYAHAQGIPDFNFTKAVSYKANNGPNGESPVHFLVQNFTQIEGGPKLADNVVMLYLVATTHPSMIGLKDKNGNSPLDLAKKLMNEGVHIPQEALYYLENSVTVSTRAKGQVDETNNQVAESKKSLENRIAQLKHDVQVGNKTKEEAKAELMKAIGELEQLYTPMSAQEFTGNYAELNPKIQQKLKEPSSKEGNHWHELATNTTLSHGELNLWLTDKARSKLLEKNDKGHTPIHVAIENGNLEFMRNICGPTRRYAFPIDWNDKAFSKNPPLLFAIQKLKEAKTSDKQEKLAQMTRFLTRVSEDPKLVKKAIEQVRNMPQSPVTANLLRSMTEDLGFEAELEKSTEAHLQLEVVVRLCDKAKKTEFRAIDSIEGISGSEADKYFDDAQKGFQALGRNLPNNNVFEIKNIPRLVDSSDYCICPKGTYEGEPPYSLKLGPPTEGGFRVNVNGKFSKNCSSIDKIAAWGVIQALRSSPPDENRLQAGNLALQLANSVSIKDPDFRALAGLVSTLSKFAAGEQLSPTAQSILKDAVNPKGELQASLKKINKPNIGAIANSAIEFVKKLNYSHSQVI